jgi:hypothetical protein
MPETNPEERPLFFPAPQNQVAQSLVNSIRGPRIPGRTTDHHRLHLVQNGVNIQGVQRDTAQAEAWDRPQMPPEPPWDTP